MKDFTWESLVDCFNLQISLTEKYSSEQIQLFAKSASADVRAWVAKALAYEQQCALAIDVLCKLATDNDEDVRIEAIDTLSNFTESQSFTTLCNALCDQCELIRAYAAYGVAVVGKEISPSIALAYLIALLTSESSDHVLVSIYEGLYILGKDEYLYKLISMFQAENYHVKCAVLNALAEILDISNCSIIRKFIESLDTDLYPDSVISSVLRLKEMLNKTGDGLREP